jgi:S1-C subfamily serine protease
MTSPVLPPPPPSVPRARPSRTGRGLASVAALVVATALAGYGISQVESQSSSWPAARARPVASADTGHSSASGSIDANAVAAQVDPAVVDINTVLSDGQGEAAGTGMVLTSSGEVVTNNHVIANATDIRVQVGGAGKSHPAAVLGYNVGEDVALLKVDGVSGLNTIATDTNVSTGESVVALGNALGQGGTPDAKTGSVTATGQTITVSDQSGSNQQTLSNLIQSDAALQPGDSGGPLVDANAHVVGMDAAANSGTFRFQSGGGEGYAIPIKTVLDVAHQIESGNGSGDTHVGERAFLGVGISDTEARGRTLYGGSASSGTGAVVANVQSGSPAADAGLQQGDEIVTLGGKNVSSISDLTSALAPYHPNDKIDISWVDSSRNHHTAKVTLASAPPA